MGRNGGQIIHEEQVIRGHEQKDRLSSKRSRRLPTTRQFFMAGYINMNH